MGHRPQNAVAEFTDATIADHVHSMFYHREDVSGRGIGYIFFLRPTGTLNGELLSLRLDSAGVAHTIYPTPAVLRLVGSDLVDHLREKLVGGEEGSQSRKMQELLLGERSSELGGGFVDFYGYHAAAGGWMFSGWVTLGWPDGRPPEHMAVSFEDGDIGGEAFAVLQPRQDLKHGAEGIAFFVRGPATTLGRLVSVVFEAGALRVAMQAAPTAGRLRETELLARLRPVVAPAPAGQHRDILLGLLARRPYVGEDTLSSLDATVFVEIDEAIRCGANGLALMGWHLARPGEVRQIRVRSGPLISALDLDDCIRLERNDVIEGFGDKGFTDPRCGFIAFLPNAVAPGERTYIEVETSRREVGYRNVPRPKLDGLAAMKRLLAAVDVRFAETPRAFDRVLGPAVEALNRDRLAERPEIAVIDYGRVPAAPRFSVIVPLYGRLDFVEYQMALMSAHPGCKDVEFIYVLDDPPKRREAQFLFASAHERFQIPFRAILLSRNVGFAPANNIGLAHAHGRYVAYLNSDVFPGALDWLERLAKRLTDDPTLGVVGPVLLFEDGSVQHRGMDFTRLPKFGDWHFGQRQGKGLRPPGSGGAVE